MKYLNGRRRKELKKLSLPSVRGFIEADCKGQVRMFMEAKRLLDNQERVAIKKRGFKPPHPDDINQLLGIYEAYWEQLIKQSRNNPDYFKWPETRIWTGDGTLFADGWESVGALKIFGYQVGENSILTRCSRHFVLDTVFSSIIPPYTEWQKLQEWGEPASETRLRKMAESIAAFARNAKRRRNSDLSIAIDDWECDLAYLKAKYYIGRFYFDFPIIRMGI